MEQPQRDPETFDETSRLHPEENIDSRNIDAVSEESPERRKCCTV